MILSSIGDLVKQDAEMRADPEFKVEFDRYKADTMLEVIKSNPMGVARDAKDWVKRATADKAKREEAEGELHSFNLPDVTDDFV